MYHVEQRRVVLVDDDDHLLPGLLIGFLHDVGKTHVRILVARLASVSLLIRFQEPIEITFELVFLHVLRSAHVEVKHGVPHPILLIFGNGKTVEEILLAREIGVERGGEERLAEPPRTAQEDVAHLLLAEVYYILCLVHIEVFALANLLESLYSNRILVHYLTHHDAWFTFEPLNYK